MQSVSFKQGRVIPEFIEVVDQTNIVSGAYGLEPGVEAEDPADAASSATQCGNWTRDESRLSSAI